MRLNVGQAVAHELRLPVNDPREVAEADTLAIHRAAW